MTFACEAVRGLGRFGDLRLAKRGGLLQAALVARPGSCIRRLAQGDRARQIQFSRFLHNEAVTVAEMAATAAARTAGLVAGRDILAIQDSSELVFGGKEARARGFGPIGRGGGTSAGCCCTRFWRLMRRRERCLARST